MRDAAHLVAGPRHARRRGKGLVGPGHRCHLPVGLTVVPPAVGQVRSDSEGGAHADDSDAAVPYSFGGGAPRDSAGEHQRKGLVCTRSFARSRKQASRELDTSTPAVVAAPVESAVHALFDASPAMSRAAAAPAGDQGVSGGS
ncbi:hypothetical protein AB0G82_18030 [Streptomyces anulatus]|uniref:hypothetical protein n=1 Tax=Streptomyces anulatus TaxID=1892 RepID=UPI0033E3C7E0